MGSLQLVAHPLCGIWQPVWCAAGRDAAYRRSSKGDKITANGKAPRDRGVGIGQIFRKGILRKGAKPQRRKKTESKRVE